MSDIPKITLTLENDMYMLRRDGNLMVCPEVPPIVKVKANNLGQPEQKVEYFYCSSVCAKFGIGKGNLTMLNRFFVEPEMQNQDQILITQNCCNKAYYLDMPPKDTPPKPHTDNKLILSGKGEA